MFSIYSIFIYTDTYITGLEAHVLSFAVRAFLFCHRFDIG